MRTRQNQSGKSFLELAWWSNGAWIGHVTENRDPYSSLAGVRMFGTSRESGFCMRTYHASGRSEFFIDNSPSSLSKTEARRWKWFLSLCLTPTDMPRQWPSGIPWSSGVPCWPIGRFKQSPLTELEGTLAPELPDLEIFALLGQTYPIWTPDRDWICLDPEAT